MYSKIASFDTAHRPTSFYSPFQFHSNYMSLPCNIIIARRYAVVMYLSICLFVHPSTAKRRITQTRPYDSAEILVFWSERSQRNSTRVTPTGAPNRGEVGSNWQFSTNISLYLRSGGR